MPGHYYHRRPLQRSLSDPYSSNPYPGINPYNEVPQADASAVVPYEAPSTITDAAVVTPDPAPAKGGLLGNLGNLGNLNNLNEIKGFIDRMGGIDGIVATLGKVQKVMSSVQQFAPMAKLIMGALPVFGKSGSKKSSSASEELDEYTPPSRPRRKKKQRKNTSTTRKRSLKRKRR